MKVREKDEEIEGNLLKKKEIRRSLLGLGAYQKAFLDEEVAGEDNLQWRYNLLLPQARWEAERRGGERWGANEKEEEWNASIAKGKITSLLQLDSDEEESKYLGT